MVERLSLGGGAEMQIKTPKMVALLKSLAEWDKWLSHGEIDDALQKLSEKDWAYYQYGSSTLERLRRFETEGLVVSKVRWNAIQSVKSARMCCQKGWTCDHTEPKQSLFEYTRRVDLRFWRVTAKGKKLAPTLVLNSGVPVHLA